MRARLANRHRMRTLSAMADNHTCRICCHSSTGPVYTVHEHMFGTGDPFSYFQCGQCGARQLVLVPRELNKYYPDTYSSHRQGLSGGLRAKVRRLRDAAHLRLRLLGTPLALVVPDTSLAAFGRLRPRLHLHHRVLDVGCGAGAVLHRLDELGFLHLTGVDPFIPDNVASQNGRVRIWKARLEELTNDTDSWDLIFVNHVIEHVDDSIGLLKTIAGRLAERGKCLIRTPIADSWAAAHYGPYWVQHDAPRHLLIHTERSIEVAASLAGLKVVDSWYDSTDFQFWGSEIYRQGKALIEHPIWTHAPGLKAILSPRSLLGRVRAAWLNRRRRGDQACFVLARP